MTFKKKATKKVLLHCLFFVFSFTAVAHGSSVRSLTSTSHRQNKSAHCCWGIIFTSSPAILIHEHQPYVVHPPLWHNLSSGSSGKIVARSSLSCSTTECLSCLQVAIQALFWAWATRGSEHRWSCCWLDGWTARDFFASLPLQLKLPVWLLEDKKSQREC